MDKRTEKALSQRGTPGATFEFGYRPDPVATEAFIASIPPVFTSQLENLPVDMDRSAFPYRSVAKMMQGSKWIRSKRLLAQDQGQHGSCVGFGTSGAIKLTAAGDIVARKEPEGWPRDKDGKPVFPAPDWLYAAGRHITGNLGRWQGSYGSAAAKAVEDWGTVWQLGKYAEYSAANCARWIRSGVPKTSLEIARENKIATAVVVTSFKQAVSLVQNHYGMNMCCGYAWNGARDDDGFVRIDGRWAHSTTSGLCYVVVPDRGYSGPKGSRRQKRGIGNQNSWNQGWKSPQGGGGPLGSQTPDLPWQSWIIYEDDYESALKGRDTFAYGGFEGFLPARAKWNEGWG